MISEQKHLPPKPDNLSSIPRKREFPPKSPYAFSGVYMCKHINKKMLTPVSPTTVSKQKQEDHQFRVFLGYNEF